jgi:AraC family transcriptional regulator
MEAMPDIVASELLKTQLVAIRDVRCAGFFRHQSDEEATRATHVVFPYRGLYIRHVGQDDAVADANQVLFFNAHEGYRVSHPVPGGDASLDLVVGEQLLDELMPRSLRRAGERVAFNQLRLRIDPRTQALVALLRHGLQTEIAETLEAESLALTLVRRALGPLTTRAPRASATRQRLVNRTKLVLAGDLARRWTLAEIAGEVGHSPVYLTQVFQQVEGLPLYRYHMRLRLARSLDLLSQYDDLTALSLDLGFYSHSHFTTAFKQTYGRPPSAFRLAGPHR